MFIIYLPDGTNIYGARDREFEGAESFRVTDRQTEHCHANSQTYCMQQYDQLKKHKKTTNMTESVKFITN